MNRRSMLLITLLLGLLVACRGNVADGSLENSVEPESPATEAPDSGGDKDVDLDEPVLVYERSGGMMGALETWEIYADGTLYAVHSDEEWQGDPAAVDALLAMAASSQFDTLDASYMPADECCDRFTYTVTIQGAAGPHTVTTMDDAGAPEELTALIDAIELFIRETTA